MFLTDAFLSGNFCLWLAETQGMNRQPWRADCIHSHSPQEPHTDPLSRVLLLAQRRKKHLIRLGRDSVLEVDKAETRRFPGKGRTTRSFTHPVTHWACREPEASTRRCPRC